MKNTPVLGNGIRISLRLFGVLVGFVLAVFAGRVGAAPTTADQAASVVANWIATDPAPLDAKLSPTITGTTAYNDSTGGVAYYVVSLAPEGFAVVSADDLIEPIVCFSPKGHYNPSTKNPMGALVGSDLPSRKNKLRVKLNAAQGKGAAYAPSPGETQAQQKWGRFLKSAKSAAAPTLTAVGAVSDLRVAPFVQSLWDQTTTINNKACYNYYTPPNAAGAVSNYPCGCVATAMAQLMRFYSYPTSGVGTAALPVMVNGKNTTRNLRGGNGSGGAYDWSQMVLIPDTQATLASQYQQIGDLTYDAAVAANMDFESSGSGTDLYAATDALKKTFKYGNAIIGSSNDTPLIPGIFYLMLNPNIDAHRPVLLGILAGSAGHAVVCDGYGYDATTLYHHVNMGWSGFDNAWYNLPTIDSTDYTFTSIIEVTYNVFVSGGGEIVSGRIIDAAGKPIAGVKVTAQKSGGGSYSATTDTRGVYALVQVPGNTKYTILPQKTGWSFTQQSVSTGSSVSGSIQIGNVWGVNFTGKDIRTSVRDWKDYE